MDEIRKLAKSIQEAGKKHVLVQTAWVTVKSVDWGKKTMVATGVVDDLDYHDVLLGIGSIYTKPKKGCKCLIGLIENKDGAAFLIDCEKAEEILINGGDNGGLVKKDATAEKISNLEKKHDQLIDYIKNLPIAVSGAVGASPAPLPYEAFKVNNYTQGSDLENSSIKH